MRAEGKIVTKDVWNRFNIDNLLCLAKLSALVIKKVITTDLGAMCRDNITSKMFSTVINIPYLFDFAAFKFASMVLPYVLTVWLSRLYSTFCSESSTSWNFSLVSNNVWGELINLQLFQSYSYTSASLCLTGHWAGDIMPKRPFLIVTLRIPADLGV